MKLRQSTASQEIPLGYFLDSTDGDTPMESLTIAAADIRLFKAGASAMAAKNSGGATHMEDGLYIATLDATDTNTLGALVIFVKVAGALPVRLECEVLAAQVYDSLVLGTDALQVDAIQVSGTVQTAGDIPARLPAVLVGGRMDSSVGAMAANVLTAAATATDFGTEVGTAVWATTVRALTVLDEDTTTLDLDATIRAAVGMSAANLDTQLTAIDTVVDAVLVDTAEIGAAGAGLTALASAAGLAAVDGVVDSIKASTDNLPSDPADQSIVIAATNSILTAVGTVDTVVDGIKVTTDKLDDTLEDSGGGVWVFTVNALANAPSGGGGGTTDWTANERTAIRSILGIPASGTTPDAPSVGILATIESQTDEIGAGGAGLTALASAASLAAVEAAVDVILLDTAEIGTAGAGLTALGSASNLAALTTSVDALPTSAELATALAGADDAVLSAVAAVQADTNDIQARIPAALVSGRMDVSVGAMAANVITAAATAADFGAEIADAVLDEVVESDLSLRESVRLINSACFGEASGAETVQIQYRDAADTKNRITATVDEFGNRSSVALDAS